MSQLFYITTLIPKYDVIRASSIQQAERMARQLVAAYKDRDPRMDPVLHSISPFPIEAPSNDRTTKAAAAPAPSKSA